MRIGVAIATVDRTGPLMRLVSALHAQTLPASAIVVCAPDPDVLGRAIRDDPSITIIGGIRGASAQRNAAIAALPDDVELIAFFDDDALPRHDFLENASNAMACDASIVGLTGEVVRDGAAEHHELTIEEMSSALVESFAHQTQGIEPVGELYGANMVVRASDARAVPFDERLPLYSWLEDLDFSRRLQQRGRLVRSHACIAVHQGHASGGRTQHRRFGYSQIANVAHLWKKGSIGRSEALPLAMRPLAGNLGKSLVGPDQEDRRQRLLGMIQALGDVARGRITPERIRKM